MELSTARSILGVSATDGWSVVRAAYVQRIRRSHPDVAGDEGAARSVELNAAYRALALARREGRLHERDAPAPGTTTSTSGSRRRAPRHTGNPRVRPRRSPDDVRIRDDDTLVFASTPGETFRRLVEATHELGDLSYVDRSAGIFEAILALEDGHHASFVVSLQWLAHDATCEAFCTLEALDRPAHLDVSGVLEQLLPLVPPDREPPTR